MSDANKLVIRSQDEDEQQIESYNLRSRRAEGIRRQAMRQDRREDRGATERPESEAVLPSTKQGSQESGSSARGSGTSRQSSIVKKQLEEKKLEFAMKKKLRELEREEEAEKIRRKIQEADIRRKEEEIREEYELAMAQIALQSVKGSQSDSLVSMPCSNPHARSLSPRSKVQSWIHNNQGSQKPRDPNLFSRSFGNLNNNIQKPFGPNNDKIDNGVQEFIDEHTNNTGWELYFKRKMAGKDLPSFSGNPVEWLNFISAYKRTTKLCGYSAEENTIRLGKALTGKARDSVMTLLAIPSAADEIIAILELQFGRPMIIINSLQDQISKFPKITDDNLQDIIGLSVQVSNLTAALEKLGYEQYLSNPQFLEDIVRKLTPSLRLQWGEYSAINLGGKGDLRDIKSWLRTKALGAAQVTNVPISKVRQEGRRVNFVEEHQTAALNPPTTQLLEDKRFRCHFCQQSHGLVACPGFKSLSVDDRRSWVKEHKLCFLCLRGSHIAISCRSKKRCGLDGCKGRHDQLLHCELSKRDISDRNSAQTIAHGVSKPSDVLLKILAVRVKGPLGETVVAALLDDGANCSLIDRDLAVSLGIRGDKEPLCIQWVQGVNRWDDKSEVVSFSVSGERPNSSKYELHRVRTVQDLALTPQNFDKDKIKAAWPHKFLKYINDNPGVPKLLIGQDHHSLICPIKCISSSLNGTALSKTRLGWVLHGKIGPGQRNELHSVYVCQLESPDDFLHRLVKDNFSLDFSGYNSKEHVLSDDEKRAVDLLNRTARFVEGKWEVGMLWKNDNIEFPKSYQNALRRLACVERRMDKDPEFARQYCSKIEDYIAKGYASKLSDAEIKMTTNRVWYLPHLAVFNPNKPGKIRVVFDASAKVQGVSLNSQLLKGPDLFNSIMEILLKFRRGRIGFGGDIKEMYLQIKIREEDQQTQRFLWRGMDRSSPPIQMAMRVMLFGTICSPYEAQEIKNKNASHYVDFHPLAVEAIQKSHYMDDYLDSLNTEDEAVDMIKQVTMIHKNGGFNMVNWVSNSREVLQRVGAFLNEAPNILLDACHFEKVLGLRWNPIKDVFLFNFNHNRVSEDILSQKRAPTKREFLRIMMSIFDPLGFLTWFSIGAKILLQDIWRSNTNWDECINASCRIKWDGWLSKLDSLQEFEVPRCYSNLIPTSSRIEVHIFCDASDRAYAAVAYLRVITDNEVQVSLIAAKSRVAPLKQISVPRLELQAGVLGCRLARIIRRGCGISVNKEYFWTDSKTLLHWISHSEARYRMFVAHRLGEILEESNPSQWRWVPGVENPADDGTKFKSTVTQRWLWGPEFLRESECYWPRLDDTSSCMGDSEIWEQLNLVVALEDMSSALPDICKFSNFRKLLRTTAWILRFIKRCKRIPTHQGSQSLSPCELQDAEMKWWRAVQAKDFPAEISLIGQSKNIKSSSRLFKLSPFIDECGILRVRGRLEFAVGIPSETKHPVILDSRNSFTRLLIDFYHRQANHQGQAYVANELRQKYWILGLKRAVRSAWNRCHRCTKERLKLMEQPMAPLPPDRLNVYARPFTSTGLDYFGPLYVTVKRTKVKRYVALFTCLTIRAIHLELVTDLTTDSTLLAIRRMASRRGCPSDIWSDNGTNFRGADRLIRESLQNLDQQKIQDALAIRNINWHFLPPNAPHMGGSWERLILSVKRALQVTMKSSAPQEDVLTTLLTEAENLVNSRPLTQVSDDPKDWEALTPNHFLIGASSGSPSWELPTDQPCLRKRWQLAQHLSDLFWKRWLHEYLPSLTQKTKWYKDGKPLKIDQVVYLADRNRTRGEWRPGKIVKLYPGRDGWTRVVDVKTAEGIVRRPVTSLLPLPYEKE